VGAGVDARAAAEVVVVLGALPPFCAAIARSQTVQRQWYNGMQASRHT
jgi:hypothetical protein